MKRKPLLIGLGILLLALLVGKMWYSQALAAPCSQKDAKEVTVTIDEGATVPQIADKLKENNLIRSTWAFKRHVASASLAKSIKSGQHTLSCASPATQNAQKLTDEPEARQFTIKEGVTQETIASLLAKRGIVDEGNFKSLKASDFPEYDFLKSAPKNATLEGFLYPETYSVPPPGTADRDVAKIMLDQFQKVYDKNLKGKTVPNCPVDSFYQVVVLASMVEEEVRTDQDRRTVAGIMCKRLREGITLGIDATVRYALDKSTDPLTQEDLNTNNPYNTRKFNGLPPGPISSPGLASLEATFAAESTEYLFYLSDKNGVTRYARTNEEHEANKEKYL